VSEYQDRDRPAARAARGPDFLPYALPGPPAPTPSAGPPLGGSAAPAGDRGPIAPVKIAAAAAAVGVGAFLLVSLLAGLHWWGAGVAILAAAVALVAGHRATRAEQSAGDLRVARSAQVASSVAAVLALATALLAGSGQDAGSQALNPAPSDLAAPPLASSPDPIAPPSDPGAPPSDPGLPPMIPQAPALPGSPLSQDPTAKGTLTGKVTDSSGAPISGAVIVLTRSTPGDTSDAPGCPLTVRTTTNAQGIYTVKLCQLGDNLGYTAQITAGGRSTSADLFINAGRTTTYSVQLQVPPTKHS
jgi:hypothetical protein